MLEFLQHLIGVCPEHHNYINLILIINEMLNNNFCWCYVKDKINKIKIYYKSF